MQRSPVFMALRFGSNRPVAGSYMTYPRMLCASRWLNNALFWIADKHEKDGEAAQLREAMQVSLQAAEQERAAAAALHDLPAAKLRERFGHCVLLRKVSHTGKCTAD